MQQYQLQRLRSAAQPLLATLTLCLLCTSITTMCQLAPASLKAPAVRTIAAPQAIALQPATIPAVQATTLPTGAMVDSTTAVEAMTQAVPSIQVDRLAVIKGDA